MVNTKITLGVQSGDMESSETTRPAFIGMRKQIEVCCVDMYSHAIQEYAIVLRVCGSIWQLDGEGVQNVRINRKESYVTADYVVPIIRWKGVPLSEIKIYFANAATMSLQAMCEKLIKSKIHVNTEKLLSDLNVAKAAFLSQSIE